MNSLNYANHFIGGKPQPIRVYECFKNIYMDIGIPTRNLYLSIDIRT